jgi:hypothetical protein
MAGFVFGGSTYRTGIGTTTPAGNSITLQATELNDNTAGSSGFGRKAAVTVTYSVPCGTSPRQVTDSFSFVLTEDVTVIAYVDAPKTTTDAADPSSPSYVDRSDATLAADGPYGALYSDLNDPAKCGITLTAWATSAQSDGPLAPGITPIVEDIQRRYANYFLTFGTANNLFAATAAISPRTKSTPLSYTPSSNIIESITGSRPPTKSQMVILLTFKRFNSEPISA